MDRKTNFYCCKCMMTTYHTKEEGHGTWKCYQCDTIKYPSRRMSINPRIEPIKKHDLIDDPPEFNPSEWVM